MTKAEFLKRLREALADLPVEDVNRSVSFYSERIEERMEEGASQEQAVEMMGSLEEIVRNIRRESHTESAGGKGGAAGHQPGMRAAGIVAMFLGIGVLVVILIVLGLFVLKRDASVESSRQEASSQAAQTQSTMDSKGDGTAALSKKTYTASAQQVKELSVISIIDDIEIYGISGDQIQITYYDYPQLWYEIELQDGRLSIEQKAEGNQTGRDEENLQIGLPIQLAALYAGSASGDVEISDLTLPSGAEIKTMGGDISVKRCSGTDLSIHTVSGETEVEADLSSLDIDSLSGDVELELMGSKADYTVSPQTVSGRIQSSGGEGERRVTVTTTSGDIKIQYITAWDRD